MREWVWVTWHLKGSGIDLDDWLGYTNRRRALIKAALTARIEEANELVQD